MITSSQCKKKANPEYKRSPCFTRSIAIITKQEQYNIPRTPVMIYSEYRNAGMLVNGDLSKPYFPQCNIKLYLI